MSIYELDNAVNCVLSAKNDSELCNKLSEHETCLSVSVFSDILSTLCFEKGFYKSAQNIPCSSGESCCIVIGLYSDERREKTKVYISDTLDYLFDGDSNETYFLVYHLMKNKCYKLMAKCLDMFRFFGLRKNYIAKLMGVAVKNEDIYSLRLFIERDFCLDENDIEYLRNLNDDFFDIMVLSEFEKYGKKKYYETFDCDCYFTFNWLQLKFLHFCKKTLSN